MVIRKVVPEVLVFLYKGIFYQIFLLLPWGKDILHYDENKEEDCNEMQNIISDYLFPDSTPENQTHNYSQSITSTL